MPECTGPGWTTVLRGAVSQPKRTRGGLGRGAAGRRVAVADGADPGEGGLDRVDVDAGVERPQPGGVDVQGAAEVVGRLGVQDDADVHALAAVDPRDRPQHRVLEGHPVAGRRLPGEEPPAVGGPAAAAHAATGCSGGHHGRPPPTRASRYST